MKKKIINGILLVALVFAASSAFVSCKDNDADVKTELYGDLAKLQERIKTLEDNACKCNGYSKSEVDAKIKALQDAIDLINSNLKNYVTFAELPAEVQKLLKDYYTKEEVDKLLEGLGKSEEGLTEEEVKKLIDEALKDYTYSKDEISKLLEDIVKSLEEEIANIFKTQVTSLNIDAVKNPIFGFLSAPVDVQSNILIACYGKALSDIEFPVGSGNYIAYADDVLPVEYDENGEKLPASANAGKLYVTVNPSSVDFSGKTLTLEGTSGKQAPVELSALTPSTQELLFGWTRAENKTAFYETTASIPVEKLSDLAVDITKQDLLDLKDDVQFLLKERNRTKRGAVNLMKDLYDIYTRNMFSAYRLKATWGEKNYNTFSETKIAALALKPLSYSFDPEGAISEKELEDIEDQINDAFEITGSGIEQRINNFWDKFNAVVLDKVLANINYALQPCLLIQEGTKMSRANNHSYIGEILLVPTSRSAEVFAPAYKKYLKVTSDGETLLEQVYDGTTLAVPFTVESGKKYEIEYQAVDYTGVTRVKNYTIYGY